MLPRQGASALLRSFAAFLSGRPPCGLLCVPAADGLLRE